MEAIKNFIKKETVLSAAVLLALLSMLFVPPDPAYLGYIDYRTIGLLFCLMTVMAGFQKLGVFRAIGQWLLGKLRKPVQVAAVLVFLCFFFSMVITNDVALITFVPFGIAVLKMAGLERLVLSVVVLQTIAANLGSMLTPIGNPQNLYLYSRAGMSAGEFLLLMLPYTAASFLMLALCILMLKMRGADFAGSADSEGRAGSAGSEEARTASGFSKEDGEEGVSPISSSGRGRRAFYMEGIGYGLLFLLALAAVAKLFPWQALVVLTAVLVFFVDRRLFLRVDVSLLLTFAAFFIFIGNMGRMESFAAFLSRILEGHEVLTAVGASQVISNVPAALLLSGFTDQWEALIVGTNLGGLGTLIASMASLISYKQIAGRYPQEKGRYLLWFTVGNVVFLAVLLLLFWFR